MLIFFILLIFIPFLIVSVVVAAFFYRHTISDLSGTTLDTVTAAGRSIQTSMKEREEDTMAVYYSGCADLLGRGKTLNAAQEELLAGTMDSLSYTNSSVKTACLVTEQGTFFGGSSPQSVLEFMEPYRDEVVSAGGKCRWYATNSLFGNAETNSYILARSINSRTEKNVGLLYLVISGRMVESALGRLSREYSDWYLTESNGRILYASRPGLLGETLDVSMLSMKRSSGYMTEKGGDGGAIVVSYSMMNVDWYCVSRIRLAAMRRSIRLLIRPFALICVIYIGFMFLMLYLLQRDLLTPLHKIKTSVDAYARDNLSPAQLEIVGEREFESLSRHFNDMTLRIEKLMQAYKNEAEERNRQRMQALAAQLTPHFIYNALNTIRWTAVLNHQEQIQHLTESLISIFMNAARADDGSYTLRDELELIQDYAVIQKARFLNFDLKLDVQQGLGDVRIPKLLLQPTVENAIVHGLARGKVQNGLITVRVYTDGDLYIQVTDRGVGFDVEKWRGGEHAASGHTNIGIANIEEIIRLEYGDPYGMAISSVPGEGTTVTYHLPLRFVGNGAEDEGNREGGEL